MKSSNAISPLHRIILILCSLGLAAVIFLPIWRIELDAAQYPEGLELKIYSHKLAGQVEIINGLNHYIGMKTLHADDFIEFTVLPYIIGLIAVAFLATALSKNRKWIYSLFAAFILFGIIAMLDFYLWEYNYGHNLSPDAPIKVPGMAYQPPLIGYKQLLNFGAFSIPDIGGWIFIASGILLAYCVFQEWNKSKSLKVKSS